MIERPQWYVAKFLNPNLINGYSQFSLALQTDSDAPFRLFGIAFYVNDSAGNPLAASGNIYVNVEFTRPDGTTFYQRHQISAQSIQPFDQQAPDGNGGPGPYYSYFAPISPNQLYPPLTTVTFDFSNVPLAATSTVLAVLCGTKIFQDGAVWSPSYPAKYTALPFDYSVQIQVGNSLPILNIPLTINPDADFVFQKGAQTDFGVPPPPQ